MGIPTRKTHPGLISLYIYFIVICLNNQIYFIKTGKQLGAGQFGVVVQAQQVGTVHDLEENKVRQVAIKMIKANSDPTALSSLVSELKILIHLGPHVNVVNLLGACTKEIVDGLFLIVSFN